MRVLALAKRILRQIIRDKRTVGLLVVAPILVLSMLYLVFNGDEYEPKIGFVEISETFVDQMELGGATVKMYNDERTAKADLKDRSIDGYLTLQNGQLAIELEGSDPSVAGAVIKRLQQAMPQSGQHPGQKAFDVQYLHGSSDMSLFDYFGPVLLGFFVFFFVFLIAGVSFLRERTTGTLERLLASPLRKWEIVMGYVLGFGLFTVIQSTIVAAYTIYVLGMIMEGAFVYVLLITLLLAFTALTLGILLSSFANNELQMMQFIPIVVVPQIFFSGLFNLDTISHWLSWIGPITPLYYAADALRDIMVRGYGWAEIKWDVAILASFSFVFIIINSLALRKYRKI